MLLIVDGMKARLRGGYNPFKDERNPYSGEDFSTDLSSSSVEPEFAEPLRDDLSRDEAIAKWCQEEEARAAAFDRIPPNPIAIPRSDEKLTEEILRLVHSYAKHSQQLLEKVKGIRREMKKYKPMEKRDWDEGKVDRNYKKWMASRELLKRDLNPILIERNPNETILEALKGNLTDLTKKNHFFQNIRSINKLLLQGQMNGSFIMIMAADVIPFDIVGHLPVCCEEADIPYVFVPHQYYLGIAATVHGGFPSSCSVVMLRRAEDKKLYKKFDRVHKQVKELDMTSSWASCRENASIYYKYYRG